MTSANIGPPEKVCSARDLSTFGVPVVGKHKPFIVMRSQKRKIVTPGSFQTLAQPWPNPGPTLGLAAARRHGSHLPRIDACGKCVAVQASSALGCMPLG